MMRVRQRPSRGEGRTAAARRASPRPGIAATPSSARHDIGRVPIAGAPVQRRAANPAPVAAGSGRYAGLPEQLKTGIEAQSGLSMDKVKVHYGSPEPARLEAHAFTRGTDIHLAPGQEHHLPHEAWHVVQQAEGRVRPTMRLGGTAINDDGGLEREADQLGARSAARGAAMLRQSGGTAARDPQASAETRPGGCVQRVIKIKDGDLIGEYETKGGKDTRWLLDEVQARIGPKLRKGWKTKLGLWASKDKKYKFPDTKSFLKVLKKRFRKIESSKKKIRPNFPQYSYKLGAIVYGLQTGTDQSNLKPSEENLALPHRFPYAAIQASTQAFIDGTESASDLDRWSERLLDATKERLKINHPKLKGKNKTFYKDTIDKQIDEFGKARTALKASVAKGDKLDLGSDVVQRFLKVTNALHGNIPDFGPHEGVNIQVSDRLHLHFNKDGTLTPGSRAAGNMTPKRAPKGIAYTKDKGYLVTTTGEKVKVSDLKKLLAQQLAKHSIGATSIDEADLEEQEFT